jgi:hypothetical protein
MTHVGRETAVTVKGTILRRFSRIVVCIATLFVMAGATPVFADSPSACHSGNARDHLKTVVIDGREYGPKDGLKVDTFQCEIEPGSGPVGIVFGDTPQGPGSVTPQIAWGTSYAWSTETLLIRYDGKAKADANIFDGKRIIQVCIWYTRDGVQKGDKVCSTAASIGGSWLSGPEVTTWCWDDLGSIHTIFNISTVRINP